MSQPVRFGCYSLTAATVVLLGLTACGGGGGGGPNNTTASAPTTTNAGAATGTQSASLASNTATSLSSIAGGAGAAKYYRSPLARSGTHTDKVNAAAQRAFGLVRQHRVANLKKAIAQKATQSYSVVGQACTDGGTYSVSGTYDDATFAYTFTFTYAYCREFDTQLNGTYTEAGDATSGNFLTGTFTSTMGGGNGVVDVNNPGDDFVVEFFSGNYTFLYGRYVADMSITNGNYGAGTAGNLTTLTFGATTSGAQQYTDFLNVYSLTASAFAVSSTLTWDNNGTSNDFADDGWNASQTVGGTISESWTAGGSPRSVTVLYTNFVNTWAEPKSANYWTYTIGGNVNVTFNPDNQCANDSGTSASGSYSFVTNTPVRTSETTGKTEAGQITVNGTTTLVFNSDGTVTVTANGSSKTYSSLDAMEALCAIQDLEPDSGTTTEVTAFPVTATGKQLVGNLSWTPNDFENQVATILDLHVNYYNISNPTSTTVETWYIDYHNRDVAGVLPDNGSDANLPLYSAANSVSSEAYDFDRLAIDGLPAGYYVISVNSYSLGTATSITGKVELKIGANTYAFPSHTFTTADFEATDTASWWRVCDLVVDGAGNVSIQAPNMSLQPWHGGGLGLVAPATAKAMRLAR